MERKSRLNAGLFSSTTDQWATPQDFFDKLDAEFHFSLDPCASEENAKCKKYFTEEDNGLIQNWGGAKSILQSSVWERNLQMGTQVQRGEQETRYPMRYAYPCSHGHLILPRLHLSQGRDPFHKGPAQVRRLQTGRTLPFNGRNIQMICYSN